MQLLYENENATDEELDAMTTELEEAFKKPNPFEPIPETVKHAEPTQPPEPTAPTAKPAKAKQPMTVKAVNKTVKAAKLKVNKQTVSRAITVKNKKGAVTYSKASGSSARLSVNSKTGKITVKKGTKAGTYKIKVKVTASGNSNYKKGSKTVNIKIKVK